jgi:hypothetical protein
VIKHAWIAADGAGCYHFCYHISFHGQRRSDISLVGGTGKEYDTVTVLKAVAKAKGEPGLWYAIAGRVSCWCEREQNSMTGCCRSNVLGFRDSSLFYRSVNDEGSRSNKTD